MQDSRVEKQRTKTRTASRHLFLSTSAKVPVQSPTVAPGDALLSPSHRESALASPRWQQKAVWGHLGTVLLGGRCQILLTGPNTALLRGTLYIQVQNIQALEERKGRAKAEGERAEEEGKRCSELLINTGTCVWGAPTMQKSWEADGWGGAGSQCENPALASPSSFPTDISLLHSASLRLLPALLPIPCCSADAGLDPTYPQLLPARFQVKGGSSSMRGTPRKGFEFSGHGSS